MMFLLLLMMMMMMMTDDDDEKMMMMIMKWTNRYEKKRLLLGKDRRERERNTSAMFARRCLIPAHLKADTCVFTRTRNRTNVMCARSVLLDLIFEKSHAYSHERETV